MDLAPSESWGPGPAVLPTPAGPLLFRAGPMPARYGHCTKVHWCFGSPECAETVVFREKTAGVVSGSARAIVKTDNDRCREWGRAAKPGRPGGGGRTPTAESGPGRAGPGGGGRRRAGGRAAGRRDPRPRGPPPLPLPSGARGGGGMGVNRLRRSEATTTLIVLAEAHPPEFSWGDGLSTAGTMPAERVQEGRARERRTCICRDRREARRAERSEPPGTANVGSGRRLVGLPSNGAPIPRRRPSHRRETSARVSVSLPAARPPLTD